MGRPLRIEQGNAKCKASLTRLHREWSKSEAVGRGMGLPVTAYFLRGLELHISRRYSKDWTMQWGSAAHAGQWAAVETKHNHRLSWVSRPSFNNWCLFNQDKCSSPNDWQLKVWQICQLSSFKWEWNLTA